MFAMRHSSQLSALARANNTIFSSRSGSKSLTTLAPVLYTSSTTARGSRASGAVSTPEQNLNFDMGMPKEMGGTKGPAGGHANPEQLFGAAYSTCFLSALAATHTSLFPDLKPLPKSTSVRALVSLGKDKAEKLPGFLLGVELEVFKKPLQDSGLGNAEIEQLVQQAHELCPYSRAVRGNIEVEIRLVDA